MSIRAMCSKCIMCSTCSFSQLRMKSVYFSFAVLAVSAILVMFTANTPCSALWTAGVTAGTSMITRILRGMQNAGQRWLVDWIFQGYEKEHQIDVNSDFVFDLNLNDLNMCVYIGNLSKI